QNVEYNFASNPITVNVRPLPAKNRPANFDGAVGTYEMAVRLDTLETETGEPVTLSIKISGKGNIKSIKEPRLNFPPDFELYDPKIADKSSKSGGVISGRKNFDYLIVPRNPGTYKLPVVEFAYFDINKRDYVNLSSDEFSLKVSGEATEASAAVIRSEDLELLAEDIRYIHLDSGELRDPSASFFGSAGFWGLYAAPFLLFIGLFVWKSRQDAAADDVVGTRMRKANKMARKRLSQAEALQKEGDSKGFYNEIVNALWGYLGNKLNMGQSQMSRESATAALAGRGVSEEKQQALIALVDQCEMALYAPSAVQGGMDATYQQAMTLITDLEKEIA
ncbi:MAG: BatD family protein, partial [Bacteroidota bacterium]